MDLTSVVIPTKNRENQLKRAINSVLNQTYDNIELIVVDDNSTDNTSGIVHQLTNNTEIDIKYIINKETRGGAVSRNTGADAAKGKYLAFLDSDDEWTTDHLEKSINYILNNDYNACFGNYRLPENTLPIDAYKNQFDGSINLTDLLFKGNIDPRTSTFVFEKKLFDQVMFDSNLQKHQDWDLALRFTQKFKMGCLDANTVIIHHDAENRMSAGVNHTATSLFIQKHLNNARPENALIFLIYLCWGTAVIEGKSKGYKNYKALLSQKKKVVATIRRKDQIKLYILYLPTPMIRRIENIKKKVIARRIQSKQLS